MKKYVLAALAVATFASSAQAITVSNGLFGATVNVSARYPDAASVFSNGGDRVVSDSVEYGVGTFGSYNPGFSVDVQADRIVLAFAGNPNFGSATFNGFVLRVLSGPALTSATIDAASTFSPIAATIANGNLLLNFSGVQAPTTGNNVSIIRFGTNPVTAAVPEASTWALMLVGFGGIGVALRRKKVLARVRFA